MAENGIFEDIRNVLSRIEEIKRTFGTKGTQLQREFADRLEEKLNPGTGASAGTGGTERSNARADTGRPYGSRTHEISTDGSSVQGKDGRVDPGDGLDGKSGTGDLSGSGTSAVGGGSAVMEETIKEASERYRIPESLIRAVIQQESGFNLTAVSNKGAMGLMQLMPETADTLGVSDPFDAEENVFGGTRYLRELINLYGGNLNKALAAYNAGPNRVREEIPNIPETKDFVESVIDHYENFSKSKPEGEF